MYIDQCFRPNGSFPILLDKMGLDQMGLDKVPEDPHEWSPIFDKAAKHEAFTQIEEANGLQFSLKMEVLPSSNLKIGLICQGCKYQVENPGTSSSR